MAITGLEFLVFSSLRQHNLLPKKPVVMELGESNWYGDVSIAELESAIGEFITEPGWRESLIDRLKKAAAGSPLHTKALGVDATDQFEQDARNDKLPTVSWLMPTAARWRLPSLRSISPGSARGN